MLLKFPQHSDPVSSEITPRDRFLSSRSEMADQANIGRRRFLSTAVLGAGALAASRIPSLLHPAAVEAATQKIPTKPSPFSTSETQTPYTRVTTYNNFYEFGIDKSEPAHNAHTLQTRPWTITVGGLCKKPQTVDIDTVIHYRPLEERVYRHRCVEAWSMVIPWAGYSLSEFISAMQPLPSAKYVQFISLVDKKQMPDLPGGFDWPYSEGLRMDEAMNPLALLTFGVYGEQLPNQNGAPVRIVLPWKWGYKSAKSIVRINFTAEQPRTLWNEANPEEYGFYSNVNPATGVRYSQARERRIGASLLPEYIPTRLFNGYQDQVASMYAGMDLTKFY